MKFVRSFRAPLEDRMNTVRCGKENLCLFCLYVDELSTYSDPGAQEIRDNRGSHKQSSSVDVELWTRPPAVLTNTLLV
ncbi:hypothetical protein RRG08_060165 [Elysia crispata]|uniref:Uncharacterized protein n=1 Tax=Elysia crispata TaxID=231223 RepID=A0AAE0ZYX4_9GAST|nr:hypothetical protein RRG08_060165 [Elysia crispata]